MLNTLTIKNYALIDSVQMDFNDGFTIITGETGAGKSILLGALSLILGARADSSVIKDKQDKCVVEATFKISGYALETLFEENDLDYSDITIIRREIADNGKSRAFINDSPVNLNLLKDIGTKLIDIHSQHETLNLNNAEFQLKVVDICAANANLLNEYKQKFTQYKKTTEQLRETTEQAAQSKLDADYLQFQFDQLFTAKLEAGEQERLEDEQRTLSHTSEIKLNLSKIASILNADDDNILIRLKESVNASLQIINFYNKAAELNERLNSTYIELKDIAEETASLSEDIEYNPQRLEEINNRLDLLYNLQQKHKVATVEELLALQSNLENRLKEITSFDEKIELLKKELEQQKKELTNIAAKLTATRKNVSKTIEKEITALLAQLGMPNATFKIQFANTDTFTTTGMDLITFLFSANKNVEAQDIARIASGGELSRFMLSIKSLISKSKALPTIIFDEIDTGISGDIAGKMATILRKMAEGMQVINITHLPQVAAKGDHHFKVYKKENAKTTTSHIVKLTNNERLTEIAKMLSGENITEAALLNARELLKDCMIV